MGYLAYVLALGSLLFRDTTGMDFNQTVDLILDIAGSINGFFFTLSLVVLGLSFLTAVISAVRGSDKGTLLGATYAFGVVFLVIGQGVILFLNVAMAESWGPEGVTDPVKFMVAFVLTLFIGTA